MSLEHEGKLRIDMEADIVTVRKKIREIATVLGFALMDMTRILTATSELTRNIYRFAGAGYVAWHMLESNTHVGIELTFEDNGPGIADVQQALQPGYTTGGGLGLGLPGAKRLMDEMEIKTEVGRGTTVVVRKWLKR